MGIWKMRKEDSSTPAKRVKASILNSQIAICQVHGCNKDISSSKDYHKRHKVCDVHSKVQRLLLMELNRDFISNVAGGQVGIFSFLLLLHYFTLISPRIWFHSTSIKQTTKVSIL